MSGRKEKGQAFADHVWVLENSVGRLEAKSVAGVAKIHGRPEYARVAHLPVLCSPCHVPAVIRDFKQVKSEIQGQALRGESHGKKTEKC